MNTAADVLKVSFESRLPYIDLMQSLAENLARLRSADDSLIFQVGLSTRESVANAICHGNSLDERKRVDIEFEIHPDRILIQVDDSGFGFDPAGLPDPLDPQNLLKPSGRGLLLIRSLMDEVEFLRSPSGGMRLKMVKMIPVAVP
jgi:serine/threonine-protein kinase RsbW